MIYDCFMFWNEVDMLECRLREIASVVDFFVIVEAKETHQGKPKPSFFLQNRRRFEEWDGKIIHVIVEKLREKNPFAKEHEQREHMRDGLRKAGPRDIVIQSDVDEIPTVEAIRSLEEELARVSGHSKFVTMRQRLCCFAVDWLNPAGWCGPVAARFEDIRSFNEMRNGRDPNIPIIGAFGGSHLSWLGGPALQAAKLEAFMHAELLGKKAEVLGGKQWKDGYHIDGGKLIPTDIDETWPKYVTERKCPENWFRPR